ncbi:hypothetical protein D3C81_1352030 [compost metagenome]
MGKVLSCSASSSSTPENGMLLGTMKKPGSKLPEEADMNVEGEVNGFAGDVEGAAFPRVLSEAVVPPAAKDPNGASRRFLPGGHLHSTNAPSVATGIPWNRMRLSPSMIVPVSPQSEHAVVTSPCRSMPRPD